MGGNNWSLNTVAYLCLGTLIVVLPVKGHGILGPLVLFILLLSICEVFVVSRQSRQWRESEEPRIKKRPESAVDILRREEREKIREAYRRILAAIQSKDSEG
jgi:hypothetical protein